MQLCRVAMKPRSTFPSLPLDMQTEEWAGDEGWEGQLANQIFRHDGDILSSLSHFASAFFPCLENWNSWVHTDSSLSWSTNAPSSPLPPHLPVRCTWTGGALESTFHCYNLHFALILLFCCSRSQIAIKKDESTFRRLLFASVKQFQLKVN